MDGWIEIDLADPTIAFASILTHSTPPLPPKPHSQIASVVIYVVGIFGGQKLMEKRQAFDLKWPLAYWNLLLSVFSIMGMIRVVPHLFYLLATKVRCRCLLPCLALPRGAGESWWCH
jgi:hypothetical protein